MKWETLKEEFFFRYKLHGDNNCEEVFATNDLIELETKRAELSNNGTCGYIGTTCLSKDYKYYECTLCHSKVFSGSWTEEHQKKMEDVELCFDCFHWMEHLALDDIRMRLYRSMNAWPIPVVIDGDHYLVNEWVDRSKHSGFLGFGGHEFHIKFADGTEYTSNNVWHQGTIPERFKAQFAIYKGEFMKK